jgi:hypothetical protein
MPFETYWHLEKRVVGTRFYDEVNAQDLITNGEEMEALIKDGIHPLFLLVDALGVTKYPTNLKELLEAMGKNPSNSYNLEWILVVTDSRFINFIGSIVSNFFKISVRTYKTIGEAETFIAHHAPDIAPALEARKGSQQSDSAVS